MPPHPSTTLAILGIAGYAGKKSIDVAADLVGKMLSPSAENRGEVLKDWFKKRSQRGVEVVAMADEIIKGKGVKAQAVPGRLLWPILEKASLEDDEPLRRVWARMLANAAMPVSKGEPVLAAFPQILSELSPLEVRILAYVMEECEETDRRMRRPMQVYVFRPFKIQKRFRISAMLCGTIRDNLVRLNLMQHALSEIDRAASSVGHAKQPYLVTTLACAFYDACMTEDEDS